MCIKQFSQFGYSHLLQGNYGTIIIELHQRQRSVPSTSKHGEQSNNTHQGRHHHLHRLQFIGKRLGSIGNLSIHDVRRWRLCAMRNTSYVEDGAAGDFWSVVQTDCSLARQRIRKRARRDLSHRSRYDGADCGAKTEVKYKSKEVFTRRRSRRTIGGADRTDQVLGNPKRLTRSMSLPAVVAPSKGVEIMALASAKALVSDALLRGLTQIVEGAAGGVPDFGEGEAGEALVEDDFVLDAWGGDVEAAVGGLGRADGV